MEYYGFKQVEHALDGKHYERKTKEVFIKVDVYEKRVDVKATGDLNHHILEDTIILLKKILGGHEGL